MKIFTRENKGYAVPHFCECKCRRLSYEIISVKSTLTHYPQNLYRKKTVF